MGKSEISAVGDNDEDLEVESDMNGKDETVVPIESRVEFLASNKIGLDDIELGLRRVKS